MNELAGGEKVFRVKEDGGEREKSRVRNEEVDFLKRKALLH